MIYICENNTKSSEDLIYPVIQTPVEDYQLMLVLKTVKRVK